MVSFLISCQSVYLYSREKPREQTNISSKRSYVALYMGSHSWNIRSREKVKYPIIGVSYFLNQKTKRNKRTKESKQVLFYPPRAMQMHHHRRFSHRRQLYCHDRVREHRIQLYTEQMPPVSMLYLHGRPEHYPH